MVHGTPGSTRDLSTLSPEATAAPEPFPLLVSLPEESPAGLAQSASRNDDQQARSYDLDAGEGLFTLCGL
jgi:hypothetical protein